VRNAGEIRIEIDCLNLPRLLVSVYPKHTLPVTNGGAGSNGLAAAIEPAKAGQSVCVFDGINNVGGRARSSDLTLPVLREHSFPHQVLIDTFGCPATVSNGPDH
jgi:ribulose 1,5-bisphosphate synthetase/thiazole synthase